MSSFDKIEKRIEALEREVPLEIRVVISHRPLRPLVGGLRLLLAATAMVVVALDLLWIPLAAWTAPLACLLASFMPRSALARIPGSRFFVSAQARAKVLAEDALTSFRQLNMDATPLGNAILLYFCTKERRFFLLPDSQLDLKWSAQDWAKYTSTIVQQMKLHEKDTDVGITNGVLLVLEDIRTKAIEHLGVRTNGNELNSLPNAVVIFR